MSRRLIVPNRHQRNHRRFNSLLVFRPPGWIEDVLKTNWRKIDRLFRAQPISAREVAKAEEYLTSLWEALEWEEELDSWFRAVSFQEAVEDRSPNSYELGPTLRSVPLPRSVSAGAAASK